MHIIALITIAAAVFMFQSWLLNRYAFSKLSYNCEFSTSKAYEGDEIEVVETVHNKKFLPVPWLKVDIHTSRWLEYAKTRSYIAQDNRRVSSSFMLKSYQKTTRVWNARCVKRGFYCIQSATLVTGDLLGMRNTSKAESLDASLIVYPGLVELDECFISRNYLQGDVTVTRWILDDPFIVQGARQYGPSDPLNRIHWPATAAHSRLMVKNYDYTSEMNMTVILNIQSIEDEYDRVVNRNIIEYGIKVSATLLDMALGAGVPFRFGTNAPDPYSPSDMLLGSACSGKAHLYGLMETLARLELRNVRDFPIYLEGIADMLSDTEICIVTAYINNEMSQYFRVLMDNSNRVSVFILDPEANTEKVPDGVSLYKCRRGYR